MLAPLLASAFVAAACGSAVADRQPPAHSPTPWAGAVLGQPLPKPEFVLTDTAGHAFDFLRATQGTVTLLYFGYMHCPDACPADMATAAGALQRLPADVRDRVDLVFITTDPQRDTPLVLRRWLDKFDTRIIGLTGTPDAVRHAQAQAGIGVATFEPDGRGGYAVDHAAFVIAYGSDDAAHVVFPNGTKATDEASDIQRLVATGFTG